MPTRRAWSERAELLRDTSDPALVEATRDGLFVEVAELARVPKGELVDEGDLVWLTGKMGAAQVLRSHLGADGADSRIAEILLRFRARKLPVSWWIEPTVTPPDLASRLSVHGWSHSGHVAGMALVLSDLVMPPNVRGVRVSEVGIQTPKPSYIGIGRILFGWTDEEAEGRRLAMTHDRRPDRPRRHFLAMADERPVAAATVYTRHGIAVIGSVATLPEYQRRGIGALLTATALADARERGYMVGTLRATDAGARVYARLGFRFKGWFDRYASPA